MASESSRPPLLVRPCLSRLLLGLLAVSHGGVLALVLALPLGWLDRMALACLVAASLAWNAATHVWPRAPWAVRQAVLHEEGWEVTLGDGRGGPARLAASTYVGTSLMVLNFRCAGWRRPGWPPCALVLFPDGVDAQTRRRLRVRLRLGHGGQAARGPEV